MSSPISDSDFDNLINDGGLGLAEPSSDLGVAAAAPQQPHQDLSFFGKIPVNVTLEVASTEVSLQELMDVDAGSVIVLDKLAGEPLDVKVNGALFARAEVVVLNGNYGLRIIELSGNGLSDLGA
jgi:flagellar motor switch protein FliN/FliY